MDFRDSLPIWQDYKKSAQVPATGSLQAGEFTMPQYPLSEIAYDLGFKSPQHFSRAFKNETGQTPNEYRALN